VPSKEYYVVITQEEKVIMDILSAILMPYDDIKTCSYSLYTYHSKTKCEKIWYIYTIYNFSAEMGFNYIKHHIKSLLINKTTGDML